MGSSGKALQIIVIIFATVAVATMAVKRDCPNKCGDVEIPFPFGMTEGCFLDHGQAFKITCNDTNDPVQPKTGNVPVTSISIENHELHVLQWVAQDCYFYNDSNVCIAKNVSEQARCSSSSPKSKDPVNSGSSLWVGGQFTISNSKNKFIVLGCDTKAYLRGYQNSEAYLIGCSSQCPSLTNVDNGSCSGVGCCEVGFPDGLKNIRMNVNSFDNHSKVMNFNPCGYAFVVEKSEFNFNVAYLQKLPSKKLPLVLDWTVGNQTCEKAHNKHNYACKGNSDCLDQNKTRQGYRCKCKQGYRGNPYLDVAHGGCQGTCFIHLQMKCYLKINNLFSLSFQGIYVFHYDYIYGSMGVDINSSLDLQILTNVEIKLSIIARISVSTQLAVIIVFVPRGTMGTGEKMVKVVLRICHHRICMRICHQRICHQ
jgi:hypothetical protein